MACIRGLRVQAWSGPSLPPAIRQFGWFSDRPAGLAPPVHSSTVPVTKLLPAQRRAALRTLLERGGTGAN